MDPNYALADAHALYQAGVAKLGTDENAFIHILTTRSPAQLSLTMQYYRQQYGHDFERVGYCTKFLLTGNDCSDCRHLVYSVYLVFLLFHSEVVVNFHGEVVVNWLKNGRN